MQAIGYIAYILWVKQVVKHHPQVIPIPARSKWIKWARYPNTWDIMPYHAISISSAGWWARATPLKNMISSVKMISNPILMGK